MRKPTSLELAHSTVGPDFVMEDLPEGRGAFQHTLPLCECGHGQNYHTVVSVQHDLEPESSCDRNCGCRKYRPVG